jgi:hypothetical protein
MDQDQLRALLGKAQRVEPDIAPLLTFLVFTGCRLGEALALE